MKEFVKNEMKEELNTKNAFVQCDLEKEEIESVKDAYRVNELNLDCLIHIFQYLPVCDRIRCERVCKLWQLASHSSWHNVEQLDLSEKSWGLGKTADFYFSQLENVISRCDNTITHIDLSNNSKSLSSHPQNLSVLTKCPHLLELDLTGVKIGKSQIRFIGIKCSTIESLKLSVITHHCDDTFLDQYLFSRLNLKCLHFNGWPKLKGTWLRKLSPELLEELVLDNCQFDLNVFVDTLPTFKKLHTLRVRSAWNAWNYSWGLVRQLFSGFRGLEKLKVLDLFNSPVSDLDVIQLSPLHDRLTTLIMGGLRTMFLTDNALKGVLSSSSIQHLTIQKCRWFTGTSLTNMYNLKTLDCSNCSQLKEKNLLTLLNNSKNLSHLDVSFCDDIRVELLPPQFR